MIKCNKLIIAGALLAAVSTNNVFAAYRNDWHVDYTARDNRINEDFNYVSNNISTLGDQAIADEARSIASLLKTDSKKYAMTQEAIDNFFNTLLVSLAGRNDATRTKLTLFFTTLKKALRDHRLVGGNRRNKANWAYQYTLQVLEALKNIQQAGNNAPVHLEVVNEVIVDESNADELLRQSAGVATLVGSFANHLAHQAHDAGVDSDDLGVAGFQKDIHQRKLVIENALQNSEDNRRRRERNQRQNRQKLVIVGSRVRTYERRIISLDEYNEMGQVALQEFEAVLARSFEQGDDFVAPWLNDVMDWYSELVQPLMEDIYNQCCNKPEDVYQGICQDAKAVYNYAQEVFNTFNLIERDIAFEHVINKQTQDITASFEEAFDTAYDFVDGKSPLEMWFEEKKAQFMSGKLYPESLDQALYESKRFVAQKNNRNDNNLFAYVEQELNGFELLVQSFLPKGYVRKTDHQVVSRTMNIYIGGVLLGSVVVASFITGTPLFGAYQPVISGVFSAMGALEGFLLASGRRLPWDTNHTQPTTNERLYGGVQGLVGAYGIYNAIPSSKIEQPTCKRSHDPFTTQRGTDPQWADQQDYTSRYAKNNGYDAMCHEDGSMIGSIACKGAGLLNAGTDVVKSIGCNGAELLNQGTTMMKSWFGF